MSLKRQFIDSFRYNHWANERVLVALEQNGIEDEKTLSLFSHLVSAQIIWLLRIEGLPTSPFPIWESYKLTELESMTEESGRNWLNYLNGHQMETFEEMISYKNTEGKKYETTIRQIINQVLLHGSYHRGQIALRFRELGFEPPETDYIFYKRTH